MVPLQVRLEQFFLTFPDVADVMETAWGWPIAESIHFVGLTLLFGSIAAWDLRLLGVAKAIPFAAFHRLVPFAIVGFVINAASGSLFLMTAPNQYLYNPAFHIKMLCVLLAGVNVIVFYLAIFRGVMSGGRAHRFAGSVSGAASLVLWIVVIVCGRMITFYRPERCDPGQALGIIADCIVR